MFNSVAMGTKMEPSYANLFVGYVEHQFFNQYDGPKPDLYDRYIDDCIGAISSSREELNRFITSVNSFHPALKYIWEISETSLAFLDIKVSISGNALCTSVHYKPTDSHSYLLHSLIPPIPCQKLPFPILNFLDSDVCAVMALIFLTNLKQPITELNKLIASQHYKRHKRKRMTEFHSPSHFTLTITQ